MKVQKKKVRNQKKNHEIFKTPPQRSTKNLNELSFRSELSIRPQNKGKSTKSELSNYL